VAPPLPPRDAPTSRAWATYTVVTLAGGTIALAMLYDLSVLTASCWLLGTATPVLALVARTLARLPQPPPLAARIGLALAVLLVAAGPPLALYLLTG